MGFGVTDGDRLFEKICLEGFQATLSWLTILRKRESFRAGFAGFDPGTVARFGEADVQRLLAAGYWHAPDHGQQAALILGYAAPPPHAWHASLDVLADVISSARA